MQTSFSSFVTLSRVSSCDFVVSLFSTRFKQKLVRLLLFRALRIHPASWSKYTGCLGQGHGGSALVFTVLSVNSVPAVLVRVCVCACANPHRSFYRNKLFCITRFVCVRFVDYGLSVLRLLKNSFTVLLSTFGGERKFAKRVFFIFSQIRKILLSILSLSLSLHVIQHVFLCLQLFLKGTLTVVVTLFLVFLHDPHKYILKFEWNSLFFFPFCLFLNILVESFQVSQRQSQWSSNAP